MPNRVIREGWIDSIPVNSLCERAELFFLRLCLKADDFGRYTADPRLLRGLYPLRDIRAAEIARWLAECEKVGLIRCYEVAGKAYLEIPKFAQRLRIMRSKFPDRRGRYEKPKQHQPHAPPLNDGQPSDNGQADVATNNEYRIPNPNKKPNPNLKRLIDANDALQSPAGVGDGDGTANRSSFTRLKEKTLMRELRESLGDDEMARCGGAWREHHVRKHPDLVERGLAEIRRMRNEGIPFTTNAAACLQDLIQRWTL